MAASAIPHIRITRDGVAAPVGVSTDDFSDFTIPTNDGNKVLVVHNASGAPASVEVVPQQTYGGLLLANQPCEVAAGATEYFGPWPPALFNDENDAVVLIAVSGSLTLSTLGI